MDQKIVLTVIFIGFVFAAVGFAAPGAPSFSPMVYADGEAWGTKGTTALPAPNDHNRQSFDELFVFVNGADGQLPVGEASPGNRYYNGGRWATQTAMWTDEGLAAHDPPPAYFQCPLLPVK